MSFEIRTDWAAGPDEADCDVARITMSARDQLLTILMDRDARSSRDYFDASALSLAFWFTDNWWRLRHETLGNPENPTADWRVRHELSAASGGTPWPPLMIYGGDDRVTFAFSPRYRAAVGPTRFIDFVPLSVTGSEYEMGLDRFLDEVRDQCGRHADGTALRSLLNQLRSERTDADIVAWRTLEACLGFDPDQAPDQIINAMIAYEDRIGGEALEEAAVAGPGVEGPTILSKAIAASEESNLLVSFGAAAGIDPWAGMPLGSLPWQLAENAARQLLESIGNPAALPQDDFADLLRVRAEDIRRAPATALDLPYAARLEDTGDMNRLALQMEPHTFRRFEIVRMIGDDIWRRHSPFGVISRAKSDRQKFQRTFAQSILCPYRELVGRVDVENPQKDQIQAAANYFEVHDSVVRTILINKGFLSPRGYIDQLEST